MNIVERKIVLNLNNNWQAINIRTVQEALTAMCGGSEDNPPVKALDISYKKNENGDYDFHTQPDIIPVSWIEWLALPIREYDLVINTSHRKIRVPTVVVSVNYSKMPKKRFRPTKNTLYNLQGGKCGYTLRELPYSKLNLEHVIARSHGGKDSFQNLLLVDKEINSKRGNRPLEEMGLSPKFRHKEPAPIPASYTFNRLESNDWRWFVNIS